ncbi:MAG: hypothetical protein HY599_04560 [Candidatus Omnitrophica bacterium]|nr:hypothetical protein [Candidatus Omnitrophota bacterium]
MIATETQIGWQDYLAVVLRRRWFFIVPAVVIVMGALISGMFLPRIYRAETVMLIEEEGVMNPLIQGLAVSTPVAYRLRTLREELLGWTSLSRLVHELSMDKHAGSPLAFERLIKGLQDQIQVRLRGQNLIVISYEHENPKLAQTLVNTITHIYMDRNVESQTKEAGTAINFIESEMAVYKKKLEDAEKALRDFKEIYAMQMPVANQINDQVVELEVALARMLVENTEAHPTIIQVRRSILELKKKRNEELKRVIVQALATGSDPTIYQDLVTALNEPVTDGREEHPTVRAAREAYQAWVTRLDTAMAPPSQQQAAPQPQVQVVTGATEQGGQSLQVLGASAPLLSLAPRQEQELMRLTRDYQVYSNTYQEMQQRLERAKVTQRLGDSDEGTKFKILEPARLPLRPVRPNMWKIFFFSLFLGVFVGAGVAFVAEYLDQSFQSAEEVQAALELPVIGTISTIITEADLEARRRRRKGWVTFQHQLQGFKTYVVQPVWSQVDRVLVRWGL